MSDEIINDDVIDEDQGIDMPAEPSPNVNEDDDNLSFEMTPEEATSLSSGASAGFFNRKRALILICAVLSVVVGGGLIMNILKPSKKNSSSSDSEFSSSKSQDELISSLQNKALRNQSAVINNAPAPEAEADAELPETEPLLPQASFNKPPEPEPPRPSAPPPDYSQPSQSQPPPENTHFKSSLVPAVQGSLFSQTPAAQSAYGQQPQGSYPSGAYSNQNPNQSSDYNSQNNQQDKMAFFNSSNPTATAYNGRFLGENSIWPGTIISGILETAINTDLPGNVIARVTQNVFDSQTGRSLLIPQGSLLIARYNSSVSYAQKRVQIVWDAMIRPDGYQFDLEGANGVDRAGMSGQTARYNEHWFEYLKAAGVITLFSIAEAAMAETSAKYVKEDASSNIAAANAGLVDQLAGNLVSRAMNIQPTLTVANGTPINIMLNKSLYLPPVKNMPVIKKYTLE